MNNYLLHHRRYIAPLLTTQSNPSYLCNRVLGRIWLQHWYSTRGDNFPKIDRDLVKRKIAIVAGYSGTGYHGVQLNPHVATIEHELREAIYKTGCIRDSNLEELHKIDWSRSSRTDKGVHASCIVFGAKLLIDEENRVNLTSGRVKNLANEINKNLPPQIRVFSCTKVNKRFSAQRNCVLREYEYFLPIRLLKDSLPSNLDRVNASSNTKEGQAVQSNDISEEKFKELVDSFCSVLRSFEGIHDFHNFTKARSYHYKLAAKRKNARKGLIMEYVNDENSAEDESLSEDEDMFKDVDESDDEDMSKDVDESDDEDLSQNNDEYEDKEIKSDSEKEQTSLQFLDENQTTRKRLQRHCRTVYSSRGSFVSNFNGEEYIRIHIVGQAFLLNQIRCMIGAALAVATDRLSLLEFEASLATNRVVRIPIAPAEGLVLLSCAFGGKNHAVSLYKDLNAQLSKETRDMPHRCLINPKENDKITKFREEVIYKTVHKAWQEFLNEENIEDWASYLDKSQEANANINMDDLREALAQKKQREEFDVPNSSYRLPRHFSTKICGQFAVTPGLFTIDVVAAVKEHAENGTFRWNSDEQLFQLMEDYGISKLGKEGRLLRLRKKNKPKKRFRNPFQ